MCVLIFSTNFVCNMCTFLSIILRDRRSSCKEAVILVGFMRLEVSRLMLKIINIQFHVSSVSRFVP